MLNRPMAITGQTRVAGLIGWPVAQSRSPALHNFWLAQHGIDAAYLPLPVRPGGLAAALAGLNAAGFAGVNVTAPHKQEAAALMARLTQAAARCGAVNTIVFGPDGAVGDNSDGAGFVADLRAHDALRGPALILGAGGAARAIAAALLDAGLTVTVASRKPIAGTDLAAALPGLRWRSWSARTDLAGIGLLVNATTLGMTGHDALDMPLDTAPAGMVVADIVTVPRLTPLLHAATARGLVAIEGIGMLLHQAVPGFAAWFGITPTVDAGAYRAVGA